MADIYPRPQLKRASFQSLNGKWSYKIESEKVKKEGTIIVPYSPESENSTVHHILKPDETLTYFRKVRWEGDFDGTREKLILHFDAVDYNASVFIDNANVLSHHGGYLPFEVELFAPYFDLKVVVTDPTDTSDQSRGKQMLKPKTIWYTPSSGIWGNVWLEKVPQSYIEKLRIRPDLNGFSLFVKTNDNKSRMAHLIIGGKTISIKTDINIRLNIDNPHLWSPEDPYLYSFKIKTENDEVESYTGLRTFSVEEDKNGIKRLFLNGKPYFHHGILDQGYYSKGLYTATPDEMKLDIMKAKELGFNTIRKHIKVEPLLWYYYCDKIGLLVWQDMLNGGGKYKLPVISGPLFFGSFLKDNHYFLFSRINKASREEWTEEALEMVNHLYNTVSIAMWVPFNEGWGQFDSAKFVKKLKRLDDSRTIDHASGWYDQKIGDLKSLHIYFRKYKFRKDRLGRAVILSEFGGYGLDVKKPHNGKAFVYKSFKTKKDLTQAIIRLYEDEIIPAIKNGLAAAIYTQLSDVEQEINGLLTYDRTEFKVEKEKIKKLSERLYYSSDFTD